MGEVMDPSRLPGRGEHPRRCRDHPQEQEPEHCLDAHPTRGDVQVPADRVSGDMQVRPVCINKERCNAMTLLPVLACIFTTYDGVSPRSTPMLPSSGARGVIRPDLRKLRCDLLTRLRARERVKRPPGPGSGRYPSAPRPVAGGCSSATSTMPASRSRYVPNWERPRSMPGVTSFRSCARATSLALAVQPAACASKNPRRF
jgi:hypothetical protein